MAMSIIMGWCVVTKQKKQNKEYTRGKIKQKALRTLEAFIKQYPDVPERVRPVFIQEVLKFIDDVVNKLYYDKPDTIDFHTRTLKLKFMSGIEASK